MILVNDLYVCLVFFFFRKTDCVHHPNWAQPALPLLLRREDPLTDSVPPLHQLSDGEIGDDIQRKWLCCSLIWTTHTQTYPLMNLIVAAEIYILFSSVMAITFIDNHFHSGVVILLAFCLPVINILGNCHGSRVIANILMINV